jgi:8-oxo-dGTP diphosphatase
MKLLYGTTNPAKLNSMKKALAPLGIELIGLNELEDQLPEIAEDKVEPVDNAKQKSLAYFEAFGLPVFSCDSGLYFIDEPNLKQPGAFVRRYTGVDMYEDDELMEHYRLVAKSNGGFVKAQYINGISLVLDKHTMISHQGEDISSEPFLLTSDPHPKRVKGFPLDSISIDLKTGEYYFDMVEESEDVENWQRGMRKFFTTSLGLDSTR